MEEANAKLETSGTFYNPYMRINRDLSLVALENHKGTLLDGMAASGVRSVRVAQELGNYEIVANDISKKAVEVIEKNAKANQVELEITNKDFNIAARERFYDAIVVDPFGSPAPFIDSAFAGIKNKGVLVVTATDTTSFHGTYPRVTRRIYMAKNTRNYASKEVGIRILLGWVARMGAMHEWGIEPILSVGLRHWIMCAVRVNRGAKKADESLKKLGFVEFSPYHTISNNGLGPMWLGKLGREQKPKMTILSKESEMLLKQMNEEWDLPILYYNMHWIAKKLKTPSIKRDKLIELLKEEGFVAHTTYLCKTGVKTNANGKEIEKMWFSA